MGLTCPSCGNEQNFQVKTLQMHVVQVEGENVCLAQEGRPAVLEVLCDECESEIDLRDIDDDMRVEVLHLLGAGQS